MAVNSKLKIINAALLMQGSKKIFSPNDDTKAARVANELYDTVVDEIADMAEDWYFMEARAQLSELEAEPAFGHLEHQYGLPAGFVDMIAVCDERGKDIEYEWKRETYVDAAGVQTPVFLTNETTVYLKYIVEVTNPQLWPAWYIRLIILRLVQYLVTSVKGESNFINLTVGKAWNDSWNIAKKANARGKRSRTGSNNKHEDLGSNEVINAPGMGLELGVEGRVIRIES